LQCPLLSLVSQVRYRICQGQLTERLDLEESDIFEGDALCSGNVCHFVQDGCHNGRRLRVLEESIRLQTGQHSESHPTNQDDVFGPCDGLYRRRDCGHNACTLQRRRQGLDAVRYSLWHLPEVEPLIGREPHCPCRQDFG